MMCGCIVFGYHLEYQCFIKISKFLSEMSNSLKVGGTTFVATQIIPLVIKPGQDEH
jgi:hypothetical protein